MSSTLVLVGGREEPPYDREQTRHALEALRSGGEPYGVRAGIAASWRRSLAHGVPLDALTARYDERALDPGSSLVRAADPVLEQLRTDLTGSPACVNVADNHGRIVRRVLGDPRLEELLDAALAAPGYSYAERYVGTNALGTALHDRTLVVVHEREHYHDKLAGVHGSAVPVRDPVTGRVLGVLGIAAPARAGDASWAALVRQTGLLVEDRLFDMQADGQRELYAAYLAALRQGRRQVFALGPDLLRAPPEVRSQLRALDHDQLWARAVDALASRGSRGEAQVPLELTPGTMAAVRFRAFEHRGRLVGALGELRPADRRTTAAAHRPLLPLREYAGWSGPVRAAGVALRRLAEERQPACVVGEAGTGKATMVALVAVHVLPEQSLLTLDAAAGDVCLKEVTGALSRGVPVLVRHAEALDTGVHDDLLRAAAAPDRPGWLAFTWRGEAEVPSVVPGTRPLRVLELPPLRSRPEDVRRAVDGVLAAHPDGRQVTFTPALLERLRRQQWTDNLTGVAEVVGELLARRRGAAVVDADALDEVFQATVRRRLTPVEWLLRAALVDALRAHGGNKERAAAALGMSRASVYRKIKSLDIDVAGLVRE